MGKIRNFELKFDKTPIFAGQILSGVLVFSAKDNVAVKNILLSFEGSSKVGDKADKDSPEKWYFRVEIPLTGYLLQYGNYNGKHRIPPGDHVIPFRFPIPPHAPNSFGGKHGYVYYCAKGCISVGGGPELRVEKSIPVVGLEDLNWHPQDLGATALSFHEGYNQKLFCFNLSDVSAVLQLPRSAFVPGESIKISAEIANRSKKKKVKRSTFQILQTVYYHGSGVNGGKYRETHEVVAQLNFPELLPEGVRKLEEEPLNVPALPPSFLRGCDGINIRYDFLLIVDPGIRIQVPILIGTLPYTPENLKNLPKHALPWNGSIRPPKGSQDRKSKKIPRNTPMAQKHQHPQMPFYMTKVPGGLLYGPQPIPVGPRFLGAKGFGPMPNGFPNSMMSDGNFSMQQPEMYREKTSRPVIYSPPSENGSENFTSSYEAGAGNIYENDSQMYAGVLKIEEID